MVDLEKLQIAQPELRTANKYPTFIILPPTEEPTWWKEYFGFNGARATQRLTTNIEVIKKANPLNVDSRNRLRFIRLKYLLERAWQKYENKLLEISSSQDAIFSLFSYLENEGINFYPNNWRHIPYLSSSFPFERVSGYVDHFLKQTTGQAIMVSETHATTQHLIETVKSERPESKIGLVVFDTHVDTDYTFLTPTGKSKPSKTSVLRTLIRPSKKGRLVDRILCIGQPDELFVRQADQRHDPSKLKGRVEVITEDRLYGDDRHELTYSNLRTGEILEEKIKKFAKKGITNILLSLDIDVLQSLSLVLTAMEYNPLHGLLYLSTLDLNSFSGDENELFVELVYDTPTRSILSSMAFTSHGLSIPFIINTIRSIQHLARKYGVEYGIKYKDATVLGDIVELSGPDYLDQTKKAVVELAGSMAAIQ